MSTISEIMTALPKLNDDQCIVIKVGSDRTNLNATVVQTNKNASGGIPLGNWTEGWEKKGESKGYTVTINANNSELLYSIDGGISFTTVAKKTLTNVNNIIFIPNPDSGFDLGQFKIYYIDSANNSHTTTSTTVTKSNQFIFQVTENVTITNFHYIEIT